MANPDGPEAGSPTSQIDTQLAELRESFRPRLAERVEEIAAQWETVRPVLADPAARELLRRLHRLAHSLAGTAGTFGFTAAGDVSRALERRLERAGADPAPADASEIALLVAALSRMAELPPG